MDDAGYDCDKAVSARCPLTGEVKSSTNPDGLVSHHFFIPISRLWSALSWQRRRES